MLKIAICDDIEEYNKSMEKHIKRYGEENHIDTKITSYSSGERLLMFYKEKKFDMIFLDFCLPTQNGIEVAKKIREIDEQVSIIFCTIYYTFPNIQMGYDVQATAYLKKPVSYKKITSILNEVYQKKLSKKDEKLIIKTSDGLYSLLISDISFLQTIKKNVILHTSEKNYCSHKKMCNFEKILGNKNFFRCHKCYMINLDYVDTVSVNNVILTTGVKVPISKYRKDDFMHIMAEYLCESINLE